MSRVVVNVESRLESEAEFGLFYAYVKITHKKAIELRNVGFVVTDSMENKKFPRLHKVEWKQAVVECENVYDLNEKDIQHSLPQQLWIISMKNQPAIK